MQRSLGSADDDGQVTGIAILFRLCSGEGAG